MPVLAREGLSCRGWDAASVAVRILHGEHATARVFPDEERPHSVLFHSFCFAPFALRRLLSNRCVSSWGRLFWAWWSVALTSVRKGARPSRRDVIASGLAPRFLWRFPRVVPRTLVDPVAALICRREAPWIKTRTVTALRHRRLLPCLRALGFCLLGVLEKFLSRVENPLERTAGEHLGLQGFIY